MSFHSVLTARGVWPADLVLAGVATIEDEVYTGRRPKKITRPDGEIWLERLEVPEEGKGFQGLAMHAYLVHVREFGNAGGDQTGRQQLDAVEAKLETIQSRYSGTTRFLTDLPDIVTIRTEGAEVDDDSDVSGILDGTVRVEFLVRR